MLTSAYRPPSAPDSNEAHDPVSDPRNPGRLSKREGARGGPNGIRTGARPAEMPSYDCAPVRTPPHTLWNARAWRIVCSDGAPERHRVSTHRGRVRASDREALARLIDADVVWHVPGTNPMAGEIHGREALFRWFDRLREITDGTFRLKEHDVLGTDDHVVALSHMSADRDGVRVSVNVASVFHFRDGRQQERWFHPSDLAPWNRMLGGPL